MVHDWLSHGENELANPRPGPGRGGDDWPQKPMTVLRSTPAPTTPADDGRPTAYRNIATHWWDGSQIYGSDLKRQRKIRSDPRTGRPLSDGKIGLDPAGQLPIEPMRDEAPDAEGAKFPDLELAGVNGNWWLGLSAMQTLFAREHNTVIDRLKLDYPSADGEWLFQKARLVVTALIAKIHTTEWTPSLMNSPEGRFAMRGNWWGVMGNITGAVTAASTTPRRFPAFPARPASQDAAPYSMTEEFTACYRMHPLMPDEFSLRSHIDNQEIRKASLLEVAHGAPARIYREIGFDNVIYSLATSNPGALALHNYPNSLRRLPEKPERGNLHRPRRHRHPARPRARGAALLPIPPPYRNAGAEKLRGADDQPAMARRGQSCLQQRRGRRSPGRHFVQSPGPIPARRLASGSPTRSSASSS